MLRSLAIAALLTSVALLSGCIVSVKSNDTHAYTANSHRTVSAPVFADLVEQNKHVHLGMSRESVLAHYPADLLTKFDASQHEGRQLETWQVFAYSSSKNAKFERWLYFIDGSLVEMARSEIDYADDPATLDRWLKN